MKGKNGSAPIGHHLRAHYIELLNNNEGKLKHSINIDTETDNACMEWITVKKHNNKIRKTRN